MKSDSTKCKHVKIYPNYYVVVQTGLCSMTWDGAYVHCCTWLSQKSPHIQREDVYLSCAEALLFTYVKEAIWSTVNLQRSTELGLASLQTPNSQVPAFTGEATWFVYKEGGGGPSSPAVPKPAHSGTRISYGTIKGSNRIYTSWQTFTPRFSALVNH